MKAVVLAAGEGVRLQPITATRPKHLIKVGGKPILEHCLNTLKSAGIREIILVVHYKAEAIRQYFEDGSRLGLKIDYAEQKAVLGTGNAVSTVESFVSGDFLVANGDILFESSAVKTAVEMHLKEKPAATLTVVPVDKPDSYGIVDLDGDRIKKIIEKPAKGEAPSNLANAGIYVFSTEIFGKLKQTPASARKEWEIPDALSLFMEENGTVMASKIDSDDWLDIGRPWDLLEANRWILTRMKHRINGTIENGTHLLGQVTVAETARIRSGTYVEGPVFIDEESDIGPNCYIRPCTSIGRKSRIGNACEIKNSIIMDSVHVGHLSYVGDSVLGEKCNLGAGTITANYRLDEKPVKMLLKDKVVDTERRKLGVILGDCVKTGINALLMPGVKVGNGSWIGPNVVIHKDLIADSRIFLKQETQNQN